MIGTKIHERTNNALTNRITDVSMSDSSQSGQSDESNDQQLADHIVESHQAIDERLTEVEERLAELDRLERRISLVEDRLDVDPEVAELRETAGQVEMESSLAFSELGETTSGTAIVRFVSEGGLGPNSIEVVKRYFGDYMIVPTSGEDVCIKASRPIRGGDEA